MKRIESIDFFRVLAIFGVIIIHTNPFIYNEIIEWPGNNYLGVFLNQLSRFAVPFFFTISGYFYSEKIKKSNSFVFATETMVKRVFLIFISWSCIYLFPWDKLFVAENFGIIDMINSVFDRAISAFKNPLSTLFNGTKGHLWFLSSLIQCVLITSLFVKYRFNNILLCISILLFVLGILALSYSNTPIGIDMNFNTRNGPFFGLIFFVSGFRLSIIKIKFNYLKIGLIVSFMGLLIQLTEAYMLNKFFNTKPILDYVFGTYFLGLGIVLISLSNHNFFKFSIINSIGKRTLGIYGVHYILIDILKPFKNQYNSALIELIYPFVIFGFSVLAVYLLSLNNRLRKIVE